MTPPALTPVTNDERQTVIHRSHRARYEERRSKFTLTVSIPLAPITARFCYVSRHVVHMPPGSTICEDCAAWDIADGEEYLYYAG